MNTLTRPQRVSYLSSLLLVSVGWLLFLALITEWPDAHWSRPALIFLAFGGMFAYGLEQRLPSRRLLIYPLILAGGIYLWDSTLPPPSLPYGPLRTLISSLILLVLLVDGIMTAWYGWYLRRHTFQIRQHHLHLPDAASLLGLSVEDLRTQLHQHGHPISVDTTGHEQVALDDLHAFVIRKRM